MYKLEEKKNKNKNNSPHKNALVLYINTWYRRTASVCACWNYKKYPLHLRTDDVTAGMVRAHFFFQVVVFSRLRVYFPDDQTLPSLKAQLYRFVCFKCITMPIIVLGNRLLLYRYRPI